jgi:hypothetical protein
MIYIKEALRILNYHIDLDARAPVAHANDECVRRN